MHILLVEPDILQAAVYQRALESDGHTVSHARSAQAAVHMADVTPPDLVVLELELAAHNGVEFLYEFRSYSEWLAIPIIIHSFVPSAEINQAIALPSELGVRAVLYKPQTSLVQLKDAVRLAHTYSV